MLVIKAGGSVITAKGPRPSFDARGSARLAGGLARLPGPMIITHGTGSFGKPPAVRYGYLGGFVKPGSAPVKKINASIGMLSARFTGRLRCAGIPAVPCPGLSLFSLKGRRPVLRPAGRRRLRRILTEGSVPVISSGLFYAGGGAYRVVSSDAMSASLSAAFRPESAIFITGAPGIRGASGKVRRELSFHELPVIAQACRPPDRDVSGGMAGKIREMIRITRSGIPCFVTSLAGAASLSSARPRGTLLHPRLPRRERK